jgi:fructose-bisphosphate aldolase, class I
VFNQLYAQGVAFELMILKPNMVMPGKDCSKQADVAQVAEATVFCLLQAVPAAVGGLAFLSGGQSCASASAHWNAMNAKYASRLPWPLTFSYARAIQQPALQLWQGLEANAKVAQDALLYRAKCNRAAREGKYSEKMEVAEPALVASNGLHTHLSSQD